MLIPRSTPLLFFFLLTTLYCAAQPVGNWTVKQVGVGEENMTPTAKWFNLEENGLFSSGNGGIRNLMGTWEYDETESTLLFTDSYGIEDPAGPFFVQFLDEDMFWLRNEGGMNVAVHLVPSKGMLSGPWDNLYGYWVEIEGSANYLFRWDNIYILNEDDQRSSGGWAIHSHRHNLLVFPGDPEGPVQRWDVNFIDELTMEWTNGDQTRRFKRTPMED